MMTDAELRALCKRINEQVNSSTTYLSDAANYGKPEFWAECPATNLGDCEDYALTKRRLLLDAGVPHELIFIDFCYTETQEPHAVLRVRLENEDVILDNRQSSVASVAELKQSGYRFVSHVRSDGVGGWRQSV